jgi:hypothetical protein
MAGACAPAIRGRGLEQNREIEWETQDGCVGGWFGGEGHAGGLARDQTVSSEGVSK